MHFTVFGSQGFIGSRLVTHLQGAGHTCYCPERDAVSFDKNLGHVIYCIGLTADFRTRHFDTINAHVSKLNYLLNHTGYESFLYLSSTRVYKDIDDTSESAKILVDVQNPDEIYNISKLCGESVCLSVDNPAIRVARLSNVVGPDFKCENFANSIINEMQKTGSLRLFSSIESEKDYIAVSDVVRLLEQISIEGKDRLYNLANGKNISTMNIVKWYEEKTSKAIAVTVAKNNLLKLKKISNKKIKNEFGFEEKSIDFIFSEVL